MGARGARGGGRPRLLGPFRGLESGRPEGELKRPCGGEVVQGGREFAGQFDANDLGAPVGVAPLPVAGPGHDRRVDGATAAAVVLGRQAVGAAVPEGPPDLPDRVVRQAEFQGDVGEGLAIEAAVDDLVPDRHREC